MRESLRFPAALQAERSETGIPGTGKTTYGNKLAQDFGFIHYDLENPEVLGRFAANPGLFIANAAREARSVVVTWGFLPDETQTALVLQFRNAGFKLIWFDGNRPAALNAFLRRGTVPEELFYIQMYRIVASKVVEQLKPTIINPFNEQDQFKPGLCI